MSNNKQGSIEILEDFLLQHCNPTICNVEWSDFKLAIEQAKAMRKEEIRKTINDTQESFWGVNYKSFDQYYNETFGGQDA